MTAANQLLVNEFLLVLPAMIVEQRIRQFLDDEKAVWDCEVIDTLRLLDASVAEMKALRNHLAFLIDFCKHNTVIASETSSTPKLNRTPEGLTYGPISKCFADLQLKNKADATWISVDDAVPIEANHFEDCTDMGLKVYRIARVLVAYEDTVEINGINYNYVGVDMGEYDLDEETWHTLEGDEWYGVTHWKPLLSACPKQEV